MPPPQPREFPAQRILEIYTQRADEIFTPPKIIADAKRLLEGYMYDPANIRKVMISELGATAGWTLNDSPVRLLICAGRGSILMHGISSRTIQRTNKPQANSG